MISVRGLTIAKAGRIVLDDVSLTLQSGELVALTGPNGAGKSTLLQAMAGVVPIVSGGLELGGSDARRLGRMARARQVAWLPQQRPLAWNLNVEDVVTLGRFAGAPAPFDRLGEADKAAVRAALEKTGAAALTGRGVRTLSGGEQASVHLARLLASDAPALLLDEPCTALDLSHQLALMQTLAAEAARGRTLLVVLHDIALAVRFCPRIIVMEAGRVVADGPPDSALSPDVLQRVFGVARGPDGAFIRA